eukprot:scaffold208138_cov39-Prasinocladus_malaysianus.AAC.1
MVELIFSWDTAYEYWYSYTDSGKSRGLRKNNSEGRRRYLIEVSVATVLLAATSSDYGVRVRVLATRHRT